MQLHGGLDGRLCMKLSREGNLEQHVLHDVAAERLRQGEGLSLEQYVKESPGLGTQRRRISHLSRQRNEGMPHSTARRVPRSPTLPRPGVGSMPVSPQSPTVDPSIGNSVHNLLDAATQ